MDKHIIIVLLAIVPWLTFSQETVEGIVVEAGNSNAMGLAGANVYWQDSQTGVVTDNDGKFSIPFKKEFNRLIISYVGFESDTLTVNEPKTIRLGLKASN